MKDNGTLIYVFFDEKDWLDSLKIHKNQSYAEVVKRIKILLSKDKNLKEKLNGIKI